MTKQKFIENIEDTGQIYTIGAWTSTNSKLGFKTWNFRFIYIHKQGYCLDMRNDDDFAKFKTMLDLGEEVTNYISLLPIPKDLEEGRDHIVHIPIYKEDLENMSHSPKKVIEF